MDSNPNDLATSNMLLHAHQANASRKVYWAGIRKKKKQHKSPYKEFTPHTCPPRTLFTNITAITNKSNKWNAILLLICKEYYTTFYLLSPTRPTDTST
jgi:hypothetical protein